MSRRWRRSTSSPVEPLRRVAGRAMAFSEKISSRVALSALPLTLRPFRRWKSFMASVERGPMMPSAMPSR